MSRSVWDSAAPDRPALLGVVTADVCVVGLGGSGLTALQELEARGATAVGLDAGAVGGGAAGRNGGFLLAGMAAPYHRVRSLLGPLAPVLYRRTLQEMDRVVPGPRPGSLRVEDTAEGLADCALQLAALRADGFAVEEYDGAEGAGLVLPDDGALDPLARCRSLAAQRVSPLFEGSPAVSLSGTSVRTPQGEVRCGAVVVAVDGNLDLLLPEVPVRTVRLQMLATAPTDEVRLPRPVYRRDGYEYWQQLPDGRVAVGGFRDVGGEEEETRSTATSERVQQALEELVRTRIGVRAPITHRWAAGVGYTSDGLPFLGEVRPGVWAAGGYCGTGNVVGALCGRQAAALALGQQADWWPLVTA